VDNSRASTPTTFAAVAFELACSVMRDNAVHPDARCAAAAFALHLQHLPADQIEALEWTAYEAITREASHGF
jgi:hypothetical protein